MDMVDPVVSRGLSEQALIATAEVERALQRLAVRFRQVRSFYDAGHKREACLLMEELVELQIPDADLAIREMAARYSAVYCYEHKASEIMAERKQKVVELVSAFATTSRFTVPAAKGIPST